MSQADDEDLNIYLRDAVMNLKEIKQAFRSEVSPLNLNGISFLMDRRI